jgi:predicted aldo/keto reductase-like oxidoreductase
MKKTGKTSRREFLKAAVCSGAALSVAGGALADQPDKKEDKVQDKVPRKELGTTGETVPILLLGCAQRFDPVYDRILHRSFKEGVDYLDTALRYAEGQSHLTIAPFIKQIGDRKKLWITSKAKGKKGETKSYREGLDQCLKDLETDYLDMLFMHAVDDPDFLGREYIEMGEEMRKSGKTRFFGISTHGDRQVEVMNKAAEVGGIDAIMLRYSFARYGDLELNKAIDKCKKAGIGLIAMKVQNSVPAEEEKVVQFQSKDFNLAQAKLKAVWADDRIDAVVSHMDNTTKVAENVAAAKSPVQLSMGEFQQLQRIATATAAYSCQGCSHICESRINGPLKVADPLRYLMYHECYGETAAARKLYNALGSAERDFESVDLARATRACPQGIDIAKRLADARCMLLDTP